MWAGLSDPYVWLENLSSPDVLKYIDLNDRRAREYVADKSSVLYRRLLDLSLEPIYYGFRVTDLGYFYMMRSRDFRLGIMYRDGVTEDIVVSSSLGRDVIITSYFVSRRGDLVAYYYSEGGRDLGRLDIVETFSKKPIDRIDGSIHSVVFLGEGRFYYVRFYRSGECPDGVRAPCARVFLRDGGKDEMVFGEGVPTSNFIGLKQSVDGSRAMVTVSRGWSSSKIYTGSLRDPGSWSELYGGDYISIPIDYVGGCYIIRAYDSSGMGRILCLDGKKVREVIPETGEYLESAFVLDNMVAGIYITRECYNKIIYYSLDGRILGEYSPSTPSSIAIASEQAYRGEAVIEESSFTQRYRIIKVSRDMLHGKVIRESRRRDDFEVEHGWARSYDGTHIHYFIIRRRDTKPSRVVLYGYGGFGIALKPGYYLWSIPVIEDGGALVVANIRGGSEYGKTWHRAGMGRNKINVFMDFIAVAEDLKRRGARIVAHGRSNGGLLVGSVILMRPDLFEGAVIGYPVLDMLRFDKLYIGRAWVPEYGDPEKSEDREYLASYSPYHNIKPGRKYPAVFLYTGLNDDRVHPAHAIKFHAKMIEHGYESYLRAERSSGHIGSTPEIVAREMADYVGFIYKKLGLEPK
jgi:prolyl oligopeptidase